MWYYIIYCLLSLRTLTAYVSILRINGYILENLPMETINCVDS